MKSNGREIEYVKVKKNGKAYRVYIKDLKGIIMRPRRTNRPPVPKFNDPSEGPAELTSEHFVVRFASPTTQICV